MWLRLRQGDTIHALIDTHSLTTVYKHWAGSRSELCLGPACPHCQEGKPTQRRYQAQLLVAKEPHDWEFGESTMASLQRILTNHQDSWIPITITRTGVGRDTRIRVTLTPTAPPETTPDQHTTHSGDTHIKANDKYIKGRYGHMVQR